MESKSAFSRRQFMELLGVSAAGFGLVSMAGCGGGDDAKKDEGADAPAAGGGVLLARKALRRRRGTAGLCGRWCSRCRIPRPKSAG